MSLSGKTIVVTRDPKQAGPLVKQLEDLGAEVYQFSIIKIKAVESPNRILAIAGQLNDFDWIIFTSPNSIKYFMTFINKRKGSIHNHKIACVGSKTASMLTAFNLNPALIPEKYTTRDLLEKFQTFDLRKKRILIPSSNLARNDLEKGLQAFGAKVQRIEVYKNVPYDNPKKKNLHQRICNNSIDCITFFSPSAVNSFLEVMGEEIIQLINSSRIVLAVIGPTTAQAIIAKGLKPAIQPEKSESYSLVQALEKYFVHRDT